MKKLITIMSLLSFIAMLGLSSALAQSPDDNYATGCLKDKDKGANWKKVLTGLNAGKCKNPPITLVQKALTDSLGDQIDDLDEEVFIVADDLQEQIDENAEHIDEIKAGLVSSMIGGGHNSSTDGPDTFYMPLYNWFRLPSDDEAHSRVAVTGWLTDLVVDVNEPTGANTTQVFQYVVDGVAVDLSPLADNFCTIGGALSEDCISSGCFRIEKGQTLSVRVVAATASASDPNVSPTRWTGRFVETDALCSPPNPPLGS